MWKRSLDRRLVDDALGECGLSVVQCRTVSLVPNLCGGLLASLLPDQLHSRAVMLDCWKLLNQVASGARCGVWLTEHSRLSIQTPAFVLPSCKGFVPHLTTQVLDDALLARVGDGVSGGAVVMVPMEDFVGTAFESYADQRVKAGLPGTLTSFCNFGPRTAVVVTPESPMAPFAEGKISKKRAMFRTRNGMRDLKPEEFVALASKMQADMVCFPTNQPAQASGNKAYEKSVNGTLQFLDACVPLFGAALPVMMAPVVGGGSNDKMRQWGCEQTVKRSPAAYLLAGLNRMEEDGIRATVATQLIQQLPATRMRMALGRFKPNQVVQLVLCGLDLLCSSYPTECASNGIALTFALPGDLSVPIAETSVDLNEEGHTLDAVPIDNACRCYTCQHATRAYLHHLLHTKEMLGNTLLALHNLHRYLYLFAHIRQMLTGPGPAE